ncbi:MAG: DUF2812 domain-containing protein [Lawsonibacter sp.]|nr:DUF2812 domain-containing protein [Lawsonibacter sp.]
MKTDTYAIVPVSLYDIPGMETWLEEQANQGLFPLHLGSYAHFTRCGVPGTRFRLEPFGKGETDPAPERLSLYKQAGWAYAMPVGNVYHLFYAEDPAAPELYSDWSSRGMSLERLAKQVRRLRYQNWLVLGAILLIFLSAVFIATTFSPLRRFDVQPDPWVQLPLLLLDFTHPFLVLAIFYLPVSARSAKKQHKVLLDTYQNLSQGLPPPPSPGPSKAIRRENLLGLLMLPVLILFWIVNFFHIGETVPLEGFRRPYIALEQLEQVPVVHWEALYRDPLPQNDNQVKRDFSLLAPTWYTVSERVYRNPRNGTNSIWMDATYLRLLLPAMARPIARATLDRMRLVNVYWVYEEAEYPGLDFVILAWEEGEEAAADRFQMAALGRGGHVAVFRYYGPEHLANRLELLASAVQ